MVRKRTAYARVARTVGRGLDPFRLSFAILQRDQKLAAESVDWPAFRASLVAAGFDEPAAARLAAEARSGLAAMVKAGALSEQQVRAHFGLSGEQARNLLRLNAYLRSKEIAPERAAQVLDQRRQTLIGSQIAPKPVTIRTGRADYRAIDQIADVGGRSLSKALLSEFADARKAVVPGLSEEAILARLRKGDLKELLNILQRTDKRAYATTWSRLPGALRVTDQGYDLGPQYRRIVDWYNKSVENAVKAVYGATEDPKLRDLFLRQRLGYTGIDAMRLAARGDLEVPDIPLAGVSRGRVEALADDEAYATAQEAQRRAWRDAQKAGTLPKNAKRYWVTRRDDRVCPVCEPMDGQGRGINEYFHSIMVPDKSYLNPGPPPDGPHLRCRCATIMLAVG